MKKSTIRIILLLLLAGTLVFSSACGGIPGFQLSSRPSPDSGGSSGSGGSTGSGGGFPWSSPKTSASPKTASLPPQKAFIEGAKSILSTDYTKLLTDKEDGATLLGLTSDFLNDLNTTSNETTVELQASDLVSNGESSDGSGNLGLELKHNAKTGDASVEFTAGAGSDTNTSIGMYIKDGVALLGTTGADSTILKYTLPAYTDKSISGAVSAMVSGIVTGKASSAADVVKDLQAFASRFFDPWMTSTKPTDYTDEKETRQLLGKDAECRVVSLNLSGKAAYDFALQNLQTLQGDEKFADIDTAVGFSMYFLNHDIKELLNSGAAIMEDLKNMDLDSFIATKQLIDDLKSLKDAEIAAAKYKVSVVFKDNKAIGLEVTASAKEKSYTINLLTYRKGLEHQVSFGLHDMSGAGIDGELSKVKTGNNTYTVSATAQGTNAKGDSNVKASYGGTVTETAAKQQTSASMSLDMSLVDQDDNPIALSLGMDIDNSLAKTDTGYTDTGTLKLKMSIVGSDADSNSDSTGTLGFSMTMNKTNNVTVTPPLYTEENVKVIKDLKTYIEDNGGDYSKVDGKGIALKLVYLFSLMNVSE